MNAASWKGALIYRRKQVASCLANAITIIAHEWPDVLGWDELSAGIVKRTTPPWHADDAPPNAEATDGDWTDEDGARAVAYLEREWDVTISTALVQEAVRIVAQKHPFHPVRDWLKTAKWDGSDRVGTWLIDYCGAPDTPYVRAVSRIALIGAVITPPGK